jgi:D-alanyl-D-alanine carboxypeptidase (penicillin-binding protein 5/6)
MYFVALIGGGAWYGAQWYSSRPVEAKADSVKGARTDPGATPYSISKYPSLAGVTVPAFQAQEYLLYHVESGKIVLRSNNLSPVPIASTTKLMSTLVAVQNADLNERVVISSTATSIGGSVAGIYPNENLSVQDLLYGALLVSGNDCIEALAEYVGGKLLNNPHASIDERVARFVMEMNTEAKKLILTDTLYKDPAGLDDDGHSTPLDLAKLVTVNMQNDTLRTIMTTASKTIYDLSGRYHHDLRNSNRLVTDYQYPGMKGGKTGFTDVAGHCLVAASQQNGQTLVAVVLHTFSQASDASAIEARKLLDFGFKNIRWE